MTALESVRSAEMRRRPYRLKSLIILAGRFHSLIWWVRWCERMTQTTMSYPYTTALVIREMNCSEIWSERIGSLKCISVWTLINEGIVSMWWSRSLLSVNRVKKMTVSSTKNQIRTTLLTLQLCQSITWTQESLEPKHQKQDSRKTTWLSTMPTQKPWRVQTSDIKMAVDLPKSNHLCSLSSIHANHWLDAFQSGKRACSPVFPSPAPFEKNLEVVATNHNQSISTWFWRVSAEVVSLKSRCVTTWRRSESMQWRSSTSRRWGVHRSPRTRRLRRFSWQR